MGDVPDRSKATQPPLVELAKQLREQARQLGDADAIAAADRVHHHASSEAPNGAHIRETLQSLENKIALSPTVNAILQALTNVGL